MRADELILISVDDHICEPANMFEGHVPAKYREHTPVVRDEKGGEVQQWYYGDIRGRNLGLNAVAGKPPELYNVDALRYEHMRPGCYDVHERVRDMDAGGQLAGLNFPNWTGFAGQVLNQRPDPDVNEVMVRAYNDWHIDTWCAAHPDRFIPLGLPVRPLRHPSSGAVHRGRPAGPVTRRRHRHPRRPQGRRPRPGHLAHLRPRGAGGGGPPLTPPGRARPSWVQPFCREAMPSSRSWNLSTLLLAFMGRASTIRTCRGTL
jgi:hypothetical protein